MKQYALVAYDYTDEDALNRRLACRELHLEGIRRLYRTNNFISGGVMLNDEGKMIGSNAHFSFATREDLETWLAQEPYMTERVWEQVDIREVKLFDPSA